MVRGRPFVAGVLATWLALRPTPPTPMHLDLITDGARPIPITPGERSRGADWGPDDTIVFASNPRSGLFLVSAEGGDPEPLTELNDGEATHRWPQFLPGGRAVLFSVGGPVLNWFRELEVRVPTRR